MPPRRRRSSSGVKQDVIAVEYYQARPIVAWSSAGSTHLEPATTRKRLTDALKRAFLPEGYPDSVSSDYLAFQAWDTVQALSSYIRGLLTSQAVLKGVGVGQQAATPLAAVFSFFLRDMAGWLGGILFALAQGSSFDMEAKQWRLFADVTNDVGMAVELASPFFPSAFLAMACIGSMCRAMTGVAGGATRAALTQHFAQAGNAADISAKESSQETATTLIGMVLGMAFTRATADHAVAAWMLFILLTILHVWANVRALRCLVLTSLNRPRLDVLVDAYATQGRVPRPTELAASEDLTPPPLRALKEALNPFSREHLPALTLGARMADVAISCAAASPAHTQQQEGAALVQRLLAEAGNAGQKYIAVMAGGQCHVMLHRAAGPADMLQAYVHSRQLRQLTAAAAGGHAGTSAEAGQSQKGKGSSAASSTRRCPATERRKSRASQAGSGAEAEAAGAGSNTGDVHTRCEAWMSANYRGFLEACRAAGWDTGARLALRFEPWAYEEGALGVGPGTRAKAE